MNNPDLELVREWREHRNAHAFAEIVARHSAMVYGTCLRILKNPADAEETAQECFLALASKGLRIRESLGGWLHTLATRRSLDRLRQSARRRHRETVYAGQLMEESNERAWDEIQGHVDEAIAALPERLRDAIVRHFLESQTYDAIAEDMGLSKSGVVGRVDKGIEHIRRFLNKKGIPVSGAILASLLATKESIATPATLTAALGKLALAGPSSVASTAAGLLIGGAIMTKKLVIGFALVCALLAVLVGVGVQRRSRISSVVGPSKEVALSVPRSEAAEEQSPTLSSNLETNSASTDTSPQPSESATNVNEATEKQEEEPDPAQDEFVTPASVAGNVSSSTGYPIEGARVRVEATNSERGPDAVAWYETITDESGYYEIRSIDRPARLYAVSAETKGYQMQTRVLQGVAPGAQLHNVDLVLEKAYHVIPGWVLNERKEPVAKARVEMLLLRDQQPQTATFRVGSRLGFTVTDETGAFELAALRPGLCDLSVIADGYPLSIFSGLAVDQEPVELTLKHATGTIIGTVTSPDGTPATAFPVSLTMQYLDGGPGLYEYRIRSLDTLSDENGDYRFDGLSPSLEHCVALFPKRVDQPSGGYLDVRDDVIVEAGQETRVDFVVQERARLTGYVTFTDGRPIPASFRFRACEAQGPGREVGVPKRFDQNGYYEMEVAVRDEPRRLVQIDAYYFVPVFSRVIDANPSLKPSPLEVEVQAGEETRFDFSVEPPLTVPLWAINDDNRPILGLTVGIGLIGPDGVRQPVYPVVGKTGPDGGCVCEGLCAKDTYFAWLSDSAEGVYNPDLILAQSGPIQGAAGETVPDVVMVVEAKGGIEGFIVDSQGRSLTNCSCRIRVLDPNGIEQTADLHTDENGAFCNLRAFRPARYIDATLSLTADGNPMEAKIPEFEITLGAVTNLGAIPVSPLS